MMQYSVQQMMAMQHVRVLAMLPLRTRWTLAMGPHPRKR